MGGKIFFYLIVALTLFVSNTIALKNVFAQNLDISTGKIKNGTSNESQGPGVALQNQTSKELSNDLGNITKSVKNLFNDNESKK